MPTGLRNLGAYVVRYLSQTNAYWFVVTDTLPALEPRAPPPPELEPGPAVASGPTGPEPEPA